MGPSLGQAWLRSRFLAGRHVGESARYAMAAAPALLCSTLGLLCTPSGPICAGDRVSRAERRADGRGRVREWDHRCTHARKRMHANACTQTHARPRMHAHACTPTHARKRMHAHACTHARPRMHANACTRTHARMHAHACTQTHARMHAHACTRTHARARMHARASTRTTPPYYQRDMICTPLYPIATWCIRMRPGIPCDLFAIERQEM